MKVAIVGSRTFNDYNFLSRMMDDLDEICSTEEIISGGAKGADSLAEQYAREHNIPITTFIPAWNKYGKGAGMIRNEAIIDATDIVVAFWDGQSPGTKNSIDRALKAKKNCFIFFV